MSHNQIIEDVKKLLDKQTEELKKIIVTCVLQDAEEDDVLRTYRNMKVEEKNAIKRFLKSF